MITGVDCGNFEPRLACSFNIVTRGLVTFGTIYGGIAAGRVNLRNRRSVKQLLTRICKKYTKTSSRCNVIREVGESLPRYLFLRLRPPSPPCVSMRLDFFPVQAYCITDGCRQVSKSQDHS